MLGVSRDLRVNSLLPVTLSFAVDVTGSGEAIASAVASNERSFQLRYFRRQRSLDYFRLLGVEFAVSCVFEG